jgi:hypothetical protein
MKALLGLFFALAVSGAVAATEPPARPYADLVAEAQAAFASEDFALAASRLDEAQALRPYSLFLTRNRVLARFLAGDTAGAHVLASAIAARGLALDLPATEAFDRLRADPAFADVLSRFEENRRPIGNARIEAEHPETGLLPEAIAKKGDGFLIGSVRTGAIMELRDGALTERLRLEGGIFDIEIGGGGPIAYAVVNNQLAYEQAGARPAEAALLKVNLDTGEVYWKSVAGNGDALLGDVEVAAPTLFASDSLAPRIFAHSPGRNLQIMSADGRFANVQGIAIDRKKGRLFVADYLTGLFVVNVYNGDVTPLANPSDAHLGGIDGLYLYKGDLIGVQNGTTPQRIVRIDLDRNGTTVRSLAVLQQALPEWNEPTHGIIIGDRFIYIATSNWPAYGDDGAVRDGAILQPLRLMSVDLR